MEIHPKTGKKLSIASHHVVGVRDVRPQITEYLDFVGRVHSHLKEKNPEVELLAGSNLLFFLGWSAIGFAGLVFLIVPLLAQSSRINPPLQLYILPLLLGVMGFSLMSKGKTKPYDFSSLPEKHLPVPK